METSTILIGTVAAFIAGVVDAIAGGGGVINLPVLLFLGFPPDLCLGTNKLVGSCGTLVATTKFIKSKQYSSFVLKYSLPFTIIGAALGALCVSLISAELLKPLVSFLVIGIALYLFFKPKLGTQDIESRVTNLRIAFSVLGAFAIGFYDGIFGPGAGAFFTFMFIRLLGQNFVLAAGNTKILNSASNLVALCIFIFNSKIIWAIGIPMAFANMCGGYLGAHIAINKGSTWVRWIFIIMAIAVGLKQLL